MLTSATTWRAVGAIVLAAMLLAAGAAAHALAQAPAATDAPGGAGQPAGAGPGEPAQLDQAAKLADEALADEEPAAPAAPAATDMPDTSTALNLLKLMSPEMGGPLMYPIYFCSLLTVVFGIERFFGLRRRKVVPRALVYELGKLASQKGGMDPRKAYKVCQRNRSAAANVIRAVLLKVGRPHSEVEHTVTDACEREATRLYANVRPINLATTIAPLLGLLGTIQGMIDAFAKTASGNVGMNRAQALAGGIYLALVTTFAGLCVAIPAATLAHWFEGRIQRLFREIDELLMNLLPQLERFEGKLRLSRVEHHAKDEDDHDEGPAEPKRDRSESSGPVAGKPDRSVEKAADKPRSPVQSRAEG